MLQYICVELFRTFRKALINVVQTGRKFTFMNEASMIETPVFEI